MTRRYLVFVLLMAALAGGLRFWADVDEFTLTDRFPHIGHARLSYCPLGRTIGYTVNMPVVIISQLLLPRPLPDDVGKASPLSWWSAEVAISLGEASLAAVFWILVGTTRRIRLTSSAGLVTASAISIAFGVLAVWAFHDGLHSYRHFLNNFPQPTDWFAYIRATRFSEDSVVAPTVIMLFGMWCLGAAACIFSPVLRHLRHGTT